MAKTIPRRSRIDRQVEKLLEPYKPQMKSVDVPLTDPSSDFLVLTEAEKEVMAGETVPTTEAFKAKLEAINRRRAVAENTFPQNQSSSRGNWYQRETHANPYRCFR